MKKLAPILTFLMAIIFATFTAFTPKKSSTAGYGDYFLVGLGLAVNEFEFETRFQQGILQDWDVTSRTIQEVWGLMSPFTGPCDGMSTDEICAVQVPNFTAYIDEMHGGVSVLGSMNQQELDYIVENVFITDFFYRDL